MNPTVVTIGFTGTTGGVVTVFISGASHGINFIVDSSKPNPPMPFPLPPNNYSIQVHGYSGGTVDLSVDEGSSNLVTASCPAPNIYILRTFTVI